MEVNFVSIKLCEKNSSVDLRFKIFVVAFRARKVFETFEKRVPGPLLFRVRFVNMGDSVCSRAGILAFRQSKSHSAKSAAFTRFTQAGKYRTQFCPRSRSLTARIIGASNGRQYPGFTMSLRGS